MIHIRLVTQFIGLLAVLLCVFATTPAQQNSVGVSPTSVEATVKRGSSYTQNYTLSNNTSERLRLRCSVIDYWYDENNKRVLGRPGTLPRSASPWVQFTPAEVMVEAHSSATVKAIITVPLTSAGGYYTMPVFEAMPVETKGAAAQPEGKMSTTSIGIRFRGLLMLATEDANEYDVEIMGGKVLPPTDSTPFEMRMDVSNRGIIHARVRGIFSLLDASGKLVGRGKTEEKKYLPGQRDTFKAVWAGKLAPGRYTAHLILTYERIGLEPATLVYEIPFTQASAETTNGTAIGNRATATYADGTNNYSTVSN